MHNQSIPDRPADGLVDFAPGIFTSSAPLLLQTQEGLLLAYYKARVGGEDCVVCRESTDGLQWNNGQSVYAGAFNPDEALIDSNGEVHLFSILEPGNQPATEWEGEGNRPLAGELSGSRLDIWYMRSSNNRTVWSSPRMIWKGYTGALNSVIQTRKGRIILPFSYVKNRHWGNRGGGFKEFTYVGEFDSTTLYSDDNGETWVQTNDLSVQTPDIVSCYGAVEPVVLELDDCIWMLIRTQQGRFYESFSDDGSVWSKPRPTSIVSSDSPAGLVRLSDRRIVLLWNCCLRYCYAYGGRQVLHGAISEDNGKSWIGYREIARDRLRHLPPPPTGDFGTAYPFPIRTNDDKILFRTGQGEGRVDLKLINPDYFYETYQKTDWSLNLDDWSTYGTKGVELAETPYTALRIQRTDEDYPAAAVWNFPMGNSGRINLEICLESDCKGINIGLTDHYSTPFDLEEHFYNVFNIPILNGHLGDYKLTKNEMHTLTIQWDCNGGCLVCVDGNFAAEYFMQRLASGVCYIRLTSLSSIPEPGSTYIALIEAEVRR